MSDEPATLPRHVAIIMDGNGRWARARGLPRRKGHMEGAESARAVARCCAEQGVPYLTLYAFSTENWNRPAGEVDFLMSQLERFLRERREEFVENDVCLRSIGAVEELPEAVQRELRATEAATAGGRRLTLVVALNYGSRRELTDASRAIAREVQEGRLNPEGVDQQLLRDHLYATDLPDPDLVIRTGGEMRLSNFLLYQSAYAELYFTDVLWPEFREEQMMEAFRHFASRDRRFGSLRSVEERPSRPDPAHGETT